MGEDDRRKYHRRKKQSIISFHIIEESGNKKKTKQATVIDGSKGGLRFRTNELLPKNTTLYIKLDSEEWGKELTYHCKDGSLDLVAMIGSVMWCLENENTPGEFEVGTRFINMVEQ